ncbi:MAG: SDR family oxidoreductase [Candidatus Lokiarchaeota archaeon]|nr:SDR family oxidoreductase [Candidatus Lokiarchaeota archaeon]
MNPNNVVITGSTRGIGLAFAIKFLELGDNVVISSRNRNLVDRITQVLQKKHSNRIVGTVADVTKFEDVKHLGEFALSKFGDLDIWINNAGISPSSLKVFHELEPEKIHDTITTNLLGTLYGSKVALSIMKEKGGKIYNMEGLGARGRVQKGMTVYGTTKAAIPYVRKALSYEYKETDVIICSIQPGMVVTNILTGEAGTTYDKRVYWVFNLLSDTAENVAEKLVPMMKQNSKRNARLNYSSSMKTLWKFLTPWRYTNRYFDEEGNLKVQKIEDKILQNAK